MSKRKADTDVNPPKLKKHNSSTDYVFFNRAKKTGNVYKISPTKIGKRPIYKFFINVDGKYFPIRRMLDLGSTSFVLSPEATKAFKIPVIKRKIPGKASDVGGRKIPTEGLFTVPIGLSFGNDRTFDKKDHAFEVMKTTGDYDALIPAWYLNQHQVSGITTGHLHFPSCGLECFGHGLLHPEYEITYDEKEALKPDAINIGAVVFNSPSLLEQLPKHYHKWLLLFDSKEAERVQSNEGCDHQIELKVPEEHLRLGPIYQLSQEEEKLLIQYIDKMIKEGKVRPSSSSVGSPILFVPKPNGKGLRLCVDNRHLNQHTKKDSTPLSIMSELQGRISSATHITRIDLKSSFHLLRMALEHEKCTAFRTKFGLYEYLVMPFGLTNAPATFQWEINRILRLLFGIELVLNTKVDIDADNGMVVVAYIDNISIATKGSLLKHQKQVGKVFDLLLENNICVEIDKCVFDQISVSFLGYIVDGKTIRMDPDKAKAIVDWPRLKNQKETQQILRLWNFYRKFIQGYVQILAPITDLLRGNGKDFCFGEAQEAAFLKIVLLFTSGKTPILRHFDINRPALIETDTSDFALGADLSQKFEDGKIHPCDFLSRKLSSAEFNYDVFDKEMLAIVFALQWWRHSLQGSEFKTMIFSDHQNLSYFTEKVKLNRRQARWAEILQEYSFTNVYRKGSLNLKDDILSRCPVYNTGVGGTTAIVEKPMLGPDQWLEIGAMEIDDDEYEVIEIGAMEIAKMDTVQKELLKQDALQDEDYIALCKATNKKENIAKEYSIDQELLCWKGRVYAPKATRTRIMKSEHDSNIAGHFGKDRTMELISRNFYWPKMEEDVRAYCGNCDNSQRMKSPRHAKHGLLHPLALPSKRWTHISTDFITDLPLSSGATKILVVVDRLTKMAHFITIDKKNSPTVAKAYLDNVWKYHVFPEDVVSDRDGTFTGRYFTDLYHYHGIKWSMSPAFHPQMDGQTERMNQVVEAYL